MPITNIEPAEADADSNVNGVDQQHREKGALRIARRAKDCPASKQHAAQRDTDRGNTDIVRRHLLSITFEAEARGNPRCRNKNQGAGEQPRADAKQDRLARAGIGDSTMAGAYRTRHHRRRTHADCGLQNRHEPNEVTRHSDRINRVSADVLARQPACNGKVNRTHQEVQHLLKQRPERENKNLLRQRQPSELAGELPLVLLA